MQIYRQKFSSFPNCCRNHLQKLFASRQLQEEDAKPQEHGLRFVIGFLRERSSTRVRTKDSNNNPTAN
jgi:hypothetical protein